IDNKSDDEEGDMEEEIGEHGLKKKIIKEGDGWEMPLNGDEVEVHYVGSLLDGTRFDSSFDREMPFKFKLGLGKIDYEQSYSFKLCS
ncbi:FKBP-type peptidyl-prolyl cis-trans isomerase domain-containing protein, partial [Tanacetum coccineum]